MRPESRVNELMLFEEEFVGEPLLAIVVLADERLI